MGLNPWDFLMSEEGSPGSSYKITLNEILGRGSGTGSGVYGPTASKLGIGTGALDMVAHNFRQNWVEATIQSTLLGVGFNVAKKLTRKPRGMANKMLRQLGVGDTVRL